MYMYMCIPQLIWSRYIWKQSYKLTLIDHSSSLVCNRKLSRRERQSKKTSLKLIEKPTGRLTTNMCPITYELVPLAVSTKTIYTYILNKWIHRKPLLHVIHTLNPIKTIAALIRVVKIDWQQLILVSKL